MAWREDLELNIVRLNDLTIRELCDTAALIAEDATVTTVLAAEVNATEVIAAEVDANSGTFDSIEATTVACTQTLEATHADISVIHFHHYTVVSSPDPALSLGGVIFVVDGSNGDPVLALSDGVDWLQLFTKQPIKNMSLQERDLAIAEA